MPSYRADLQRGTNTYDRVDYQAAIWDWGRFLKQTCVGCRYFHPQVIYLRKGKLFDLML